MRSIIALGISFLSLPAMALAQEAFDACALFTQVEAEKVMQTAAAGEPDHPRVKRPRVVTSCAYHGFKDGKAVEAKAQFRFARSDAEAQRAFDDARFDLQTKPLLIGGAEAFWSGRTGQLNVRKGRAWITLSVGPSTLRERDIEPARKLAQILVEKL